MTKPSVGIVLSGGGARGAYEVGVIQGIVEAVGPKPGDPALFQVIAGTSVGAINGAWLAANAHHEDHAIDEFADVWRGLQLRQNLRVDLIGLAGWTSPLRFLRTASRGNPETLGRSVLDPTGLETLVRTTIDFERVHDNVNRGLVKAFLVAALHIGTGTTTMFAELAPGAQFRRMKHPRRVARLERVEFEHVLASSAIPALFPARRVGRSYFADGSLRFNTPIAPAIRAGAEKLVVITLRHDLDEAPNIEGPGRATEQYPSAIFLLGKLFNALLLDPVAYDLQILERFNRMQEVLDQSLSPDEKARVDGVLEETRGMGYRKLETLVFEPSENIGIMAGDHLREHLAGWSLGRFYEWILAKAANVDATWEADLASYLLFDGAWASKLIALGKKDALAKRDEIRAFFEAT